MNLAETLKKCQLHHIGGQWHLTLPLEQIKEYAKFKKEITGIGGKWHTGKQAFIFEKDPSEILNKMKNEGYSGFEKDRQFFATPPEIIEDLMEYVILWDGVQVLEPEGGRGGLIHALYKKAAEEEKRMDLDYCEIDSYNRSFIKQGNFLCPDFLRLQTDKRYDVIVANPPFSKGQDMLHLSKMIDLMNREYSTLYCILPSECKGKVEKLLRSKKLSVHDDDHNFVYQMDTVYKKGAFDRTQIETRLFTANFL